MEQLFPVKSVKYSQIYSIYTTRFRPQGGGLRVEEEGREKLKKDGLRRSGKVEGRKEEEDGIREGQRKEKGGRREGKKD